MGDRPGISIGIVSSEKLGFYLDGDFAENNGTVFIKGNYSAFAENGKIIIENLSGLRISRTQFQMYPLSDAFFELKQVVIGIDFHWEQKEDQRFHGILKFIPEGSKVSAINIIDIEEYLKSVISSEMSSTSSPELLKAHAVISRSWLLAQIEKNKNLGKTIGKYNSSFESETEIIRWYDREDHRDFDVCADDHCQRYQGITKIYSQKALEAVEQTLGEVLIVDDEICDARFSKCCGGISEDFRNAWEPVAHSYLLKIIDNPVEPENYNINLESEENAEKWILGNPPAFCNTADNQILSQVLPGFDQATTDFYRWKVDYSQNELSELIKNRSGIDFGEIIKLESFQRGTSGRIVKLIIQGTKKTITVGKELEIRKWLSKSHLYSSAFVVEYENFINGIPRKFVLKGAGWGHGVGLCQIGAAVMGEKGYTYTEILLHYFKGVVLKKLYK